MKFRTAFTMIELIFVIVILGVLASVAIPRLSATRDDAYNARLAQNIMTGAGEIASYAVSKGQTENNLTDMSNALIALIRSGDGVENSAERTVNVKRGGIDDCVFIKVQTQFNEENLTVGFGSANGDGNCLRLQELIDVNVYPMVLRGSQVVH